eukprot:1160782-Pelagomonas_calceolata.AAC.5
MHSFVYLSPAAVLYLYFGIRERLPPAWSASCFCPLTATFLGAAAHRMQDLAFHQSANFVLQAVLAATSTPAQLPLRCILGGWELFVPFMRVLIHGSKVIGGFPANVPPYQQNRRNQFVEKMIAHSIHQGILMLACTYTVTALRLISRTSYSQFLCEIQTLCPELLAWCLSRTTEAADLRLSDHFGACLLEHHPPSSMKVHPLCQELASPCIGSLL